MLFERVQTCGTNGFRNQVNGSDGIITNIPHSLCASNTSAMTPIDQALPADPAATEDKGFHSFRHRIRSIGPFWDFDFMYSYDCCTICSRIGSSTSLSSLDVHAVPSTSMFT